MSDEMDDILHRSLDEVDRARRRQWAYLALCFCCLAVFVFTVTEIARNIGDSRLGTEVLLDAIVSILTTILAVLGLSLFINRMTNKILKAIELLSKR